jgi:hypothetical protein
MNNEEIFKLLIDKIADNSLYLRETSKKIDDIKDSYVDIKIAMDSHKIIDEKMHEEIKESMKSVTGRLDEYNRQLEIHILATEENRKDITNLKTSVSPLIEKHTEKTIIDRAKEKKWKTIAAISTVLGLAKFIIDFLK